MPFEIVRNDIVNMQVDAIVNTTNSLPAVGYGVDFGIHEKAGPKLLEARKRLGTIPVGAAALTPAYDLNARYVIHTVCPVWQGGDHSEAKLLRRCYDSCLELALRKRCRSIAFPLMSAGNHGFPKDLALETAMNAISAFLLKHEMQVYLVVFSRSAWQLSEKLYRGVASFIDECYVREKNLAQYGVADKCNVRQAQQEEYLRQQRNIRRMETIRAAEESVSAPDAESPVFPETSEAAFECEAEFSSRMPDPEAYLPPRESARPPLEKWEAPRRSAAMYDSAPPAAKRARGVHLPSVSLPVSLEDMLKKADAGFTETLIRMIDKTGKKDSEIYKKANIDRKLFSKIRKNKHYQPSKPTAVAFAIALELDLEQTRDFIGRAGFALSRSSTFDIIIEYFIVNRNYNIHEINMILFEYDQSLLGS